MSRGLALIGGLLLVAACGTVTPLPTSIAGSGHVISEGRAVGSFGTVDVRGPLAVHVTAGADSSVTVTADDNLLPIISTTVTGGRLVIELPSNTSVRTSTPLTVAVGTAQLDALSGHAASRITLDRLASPELSVTLDAASQVTGSGDVGHLVLAASAASIARLSTVQVERADVTLHAASIAELTASDAVSGEAHEASVLRIHGNPPSVSVDTSEMSRVFTE